MKCLRVLNQSGVYMDIIGLSAENFDVKKRENQLLLKHTKSLMMMFKG